MKLQFTNQERTACTFGNESFGLSAPDDFDSIGNGPTRDAVKAWLAAGNKPIPFSSPSLDAVKAQLVAEVDERVGAIQMRFERFRSEYEMREEQAAAYRAAGYAGQVPEMVSGFATPARMDAKAAADRILLQAANLRAAVPKLGNLRMRKYEINFAASEAEARRTRDLIIQTAEMIQATL